MAAGATKPEMAWKTRLMAWIVYSFPMLMMNTMYKKTVDNTYEKFSVIRRKDGAVWHQRTDRHASGFILSSYPKLWSKYVPGMRDSFERSPDLHPRVVEAGHERCALPSIRVGLLDPYT